MLRVAIRVLGNGRTRQTIEAGAEAPAGCPFLTYLAVVAGFAASFALLGALI